MVTNAQRKTFDHRAAPPAAPLGGTLGVIALAFGIGVLGAYMLDLHGHQCETCGHKWRHLGAFNLGDPASHTCSHCGQEQWWKCGWQTAVGARPPDRPFGMSRPPSQQLALSSGSSLAKALEPYR